MKLIKDFNFLHSLKFENHTFMSHAFYVAMPSKSTNKLEIAFLKHIFYEKIFHANVLQVNEHFIMLLNVKMVNH